MTELAQEIIATDGFLGGQLQLRQPTRGHRAGTDAVLLAAAAPAELDGLALDIGAGVGAAGLALAKLRPQITLGLVENDPSTAALARDNLVLNGLDDRGRVYEADIACDASRHAAGLRDGLARLVVTNPPYFDPERTRLSPEQGTRAARTMPTAGPGSLAAWIAASINLLENDGMFIIIHRPEALPEILVAVSGRAGAVALLPVQPREGATATRILLRAKKGSRAPLTIAPALVLHSGGQFAPQAQAIHRGKAFIQW